MQIQSNINHILFIFITSALVSALSTKNHLTTQLAKLLQKDRERMTNVLGLGFKGLL